MLKYEEKLHFDELYKKFQSNSILHKTIGLIWGIVVYILLYFLIKFVLLNIPDIQPWNNLKTWFTLNDVRFVKADIVYFAFGFIIHCYGIIKLSKISLENHNAKNVNGNAPKKLLTNGFYAKVRHPMYGTFIILQASLMISLRSFVGLIIALLIGGVQYLNAVIEEKKQLIPIFGEEYTLYSKNVRGMLLTKSDIIILLLAVIFSILGFAFC